MIYWILLIILAVAVILLVIGCNYCGALWDAIGGISIVLVILGSILTAFCTFQVFSETFWSEPHKAELLAEREVLEYRLNNPYTENDNNFGSTELYHDITDFNSKIAKGRALHVNKWTYLFAGSYYNDVEPIELN